MTEPTVREQLETQLVVAHYAGLMNSNAERRKYVNAMIEYGRLLKIATAADLAPAPVKERLTPIPQRPVINSLEALRVAREKFARLELEERRLAAICAGPLYKQGDASVDERLRATRSELAALAIEIKLGAHMEQPHG
jgi:hypothetical protein